MIHRYSHARNFAKLSNVPLSLNAGLQLHVHIHSWKKEHKEEEEKKIRWRSISMIVPGSGFRDCEDAAEG